jgi:long-chain acyl-CoA synthetase
VTETEILAFCLERLAPYKAPKELEFREELPKSAVGKLLRRVLADEARAGMVAGTAAGTRIEPEPGTMPPPQG